MSLKHYRDIELQRDELIRKRDLARQEADSCQKKICALISLLEIHGTLKNMQEYFLEGPTQ